MTKKHSKIESPFADMMADYFRKLIVEFEKGESVYGKKYIDIFSLHAPPHPAKVLEEVSQGLLYRINKEGWEG